ncbi:MAG: cytochrome c biogenesis protein CcdA, partial [Actinomyces sp.]
MELALAFPFSIGLVAAFNPCGFAMLPAYLSYFMGLDGGEADRSGDPAALLRNVVRAILVGLVLTAGFMVVFGTVGVLVNTVISQGFIFERVPYATVVFGVALIPLGIAMVAGFNPTIRLPKLNRGTGDRQLSSMFMFGVSYAIVSLSCTAPLFLTQVVGSFTSDGWVEGTATFLAYAAGMGAVITFLTLSLALARANVARNLRRVLPHITRISGVLLVAAGGYLITYGVWEIRILRGEATSNALVEWFEQLQFTVQN